MLSHFDGIEWIVSINLKLLKTHSMRKQQQTGSAEKHAVESEDFLMTGGRRRKSGIVNYNYTLSRNEKHRTNIHMLPRWKTEKYFALLSRKSFHSLMKWQTGRRRLRQITINLIACLHHFIKFSISLPTWHYELIA